MAIDYCQEIADIISDYRQHDRKSGSLDTVFNKYHVERWISQFDNNQDIILEETANLLSEYYFPEGTIVDYLETIYSSNKIWGSRISNAISDTIFLDCQSKGHSQHELYIKSRNIILDLYGVDINDYDTDSKNFLYVDDCLFSGNTLRKDILNLLGDIPNGSTIDAVFIAVHSFSQWWVKQTLKEILDEKNITLNIWSFKEIQNSGGKNLRYECLWPIEYCSELLDKYLQLIDQEANDNPEKKVRLFRETKYTGGPYTSNTNRVIFEQELMEAGLKIMGFCENPKQYMRPMGFDNRISFGFGAFFATHMNMSNNCPLAFWWGDPNANSWHPLSRWYPLLPRKTNEPGGW